MPRSSLSSCHFFTTITANFVTKTCMDGSVVEALGAKVSDSLKTSQEKKIFALEAELKSLKQALGNMNTALAGEEETRRRASHPGNAWCCHWSGGGMSDGIRSNGSNLSLSSAKDQPHLTADSGSIVASGRNCFAQQAILCKT